MNLTKSQKSSFDSDGFLIVKSDQWIQLKSEIESEMLRITKGILSKHSFWSTQLDSFNGLNFQEVVTEICRLEKDNPNILITNVLYEYFPKTPMLYKALASSDVLEVIKQLGCSEPIPTTVPVTRIDRPGNTFYLTPWHQDYWYSLVSLNSMTIWFPLFDLSKDMGLLEVIPSSHKMGLCPFKEFQGYEPYEAIFSEDLLQKKIEVPVARDEILVFYQTLLHKSQINQSSTPRISIQLRYNDLANSDVLKNSFTPVHSDYVIKKQNELLKSWG